MVTRFWDGVKIFANSGHYKRKGTLVGNWSWRRTSSVYSDRNGEELKLKHRLAVVVLAVSVLFGSVNAFAQSAERSPREIQQALQDKGFNPGVIDGVWGKKSANALKEFQRQNGLSASGRIDDRTLSALFPRYPGLERKNSEIDDKIEETKLPAVAIEATPVGVLTEVEIREDVRSVGKAEERLPLAAQDDPVIKKTVRVDNPATLLDTISEKVSAPAEPERHSIGSYALATIAIAVLALLARRRKSKRQRETLEVVVDEPPRAIRQAVTPFVAKEEVHSVTAEKPLQSSLQTSLAAHDGKVREWVAANVVDKKPDRLGLDNDSLSMIEEKDVLPAPVSMSSPSANDAAVKEWIAANASRARERVEEPTRGFFGLRKPASTPPAPEKSTTGWIGKDSEVMVAGVVIARGLIYVGGYLGKQGRVHEIENCLIDPKLKVAQWGDREGRTMGYWPSYSAITPEARRSYLEWLASDRSDPDAYIGYVFLYFYGLERRLLLDRDATDADDIAHEVRRLLEIYGGNHSFHRYAVELLTAVELKRGEPSAQFIARIEPNGYEVPTAIKIAIGVRVRDDRVIEPELMFRFAMTHPETRTRTPAKRAPQLVRQLFALKMGDEFPNGYRYKAARAKPLQKKYKACSGSFEIDIDILGGNIPDVTHHAQPIGTARRIFDQCSDALDDYSRALGRIPGLVPDLAAVSRLPRVLREEQAALLEGSPVMALSAIAADGVVSTVAAIADIVKLDVGSQPSKGKLRELSQLLAAFGLGATFDPAYAVKTLSVNDPATLFAIEGKIAAEPTERFRASQLAVMLGMIIGHADGDFHDDERASLVARVERETTLSFDERTRLKAEMLLAERHPHRLDEWLKRLKDVPTDARSTVADELVSVAAADGNLHAEEVKKLELIFRKLGIDRGTLYDRLHARPAVGVTIAARPGDREDRAEAPSSPIDFSRLQSIRIETSVTANVLADIFADDEPDIAEPIMVVAEQSPTGGEIFEGLEQRYASLLNELRSRPSWSAADFEHLVRDAGLMPGAAREAINDWSLDLYDELVIEGDDPVDVNIHLLPLPEAPIFADFMEGTPA